ncbi:MAG: hypothetical protein RIQ53_865 [Pseudomonadota bacterium]
MPARPHPPRLLSAAAGRARRVTAACAVVCSGALLLAGGVRAQSAGEAPVLQPGQVSESVLVDALALDEPAAPAAAPADGMTARGLRPAPAAAAAVTQAAQRKPAGPGKASLLITFTTGSAELTPESQTVLATVAKALQSDRLAGFSFSVEGHADPRGGDDVNQKLSADRAASVAQFLTRRHGIPAERLAPVGKGSTELLNTRRPDAPENRRVTLVTRR